MIFEKQIKKLSVVDIGVLKVAMIFFGLWLAKIWPAILGLHQWVYLGIWLALCVYLLYRLK